MDDAYKYFEEMVTEMRYIVPHLPRWNPAQPLPATSLRMEEVKWKEYCEKKQSECHFVCARDVEPFPVIPRFFMEKFTKVCDQMKKPSVLEI